MEISSRKMLDKIEDLLHQAKAAETEPEAVKYIIAIQAVCELMTDGKSETSAAAEPITMPSAGPVFSNVPETSIRQPSLPQGKPAPIEGANGNSLFDF
ncbi:YwdI family protein [Peribacillus deserti]|uniref:YwdI family protein n=1 Tax=Peribacillus deserti TaxID=673318 RepID=A0A2N5M7A7_9BACI|nr:YwdI family protein [Peribacillus deserti]PLT30254.1 hypothetical protein CUU66_08495 [Peribacillus deserti]